MGAPLAQCVHGATICAFGRTRNPYFVIPGASLLFDNRFLMLLLHWRYVIFGFSPNSHYFQIFSPFFTHSLLIFAVRYPFSLDFSSLWRPSFAAAALLILCLRAVRANKSFRIVCIKLYCTSGAICCRATLVQKADMSRNQVDTAGDLPIDSVQSATKVAAANRAALSILQTPAPQQARQAFAHWSHTASPALARSSSHVEEIDHWMVTQWEAIAEFGISDDQLHKFAESCGMTGVDMPEFVTILGAYCGRKALRVDLWDGTFLDAPSTTADTSATA